ncbi:hypothetical protein FJ364_03845 [Candidatus Dependentiae bacterium]|nr:hypothetical protein [Candidatus Dependentiae bacterium]
MKKSVLRHIAFVATLLLANTCLVTLHGTCAIKKNTRRIVKRTLTLDDNPIPSSQITNRSEKPWTLLVYIAANNNLHTFALQNMRQMAKIGSNANINIVVQFDGVGDRKIKRYLIEQGQPKLLETLEPNESTISGTPHSLYQFIKWGYQNFPAQHLAIDLWNHGSGIKDPSIWGKFLMSHRDDLFALNPDTRLLELNRHIESNQEESEDDEILFNIETKTLFANLALELMKKRGIAFNDTEEVYIDNQQLKLVLDNVCHFVLGDKKIDLILMDACHMGMVEIASKMRAYVNFMVGSSEVEPGSGYDYELLLAPFTSQPLSPKAFALHAVQAYERQYKTTHADFTQAAVELSTFLPLEQIFNQLARTMREVLSQQESRKMFEIIKVVRFSSKYTTEFYDPDYIDAGHFLVSMICKTKEVLANPDSISQEIRTAFEKIITLAEEGYAILTTTVITETHGSNLPMSHGLGIFFPKRNIHSSYLKTTFDQATGWSVFLAKFLNRIKYGRLLGEEEEVIEE